MVNGKEWTVETWAEYTRAQFVSMEKLMHANDRRYEERFASQQAGIQKAEASNAERFRNTNEWREAMNDLGTKMMPRAEAATIINSISERVTQLSDRVKSIDGQSAGKATFWGYIVGGVGFLTGLASLAALYAKMGGGK